MGKWDLDPAFQYVDQEGWLQHDSGHLQFSGAQYSNDQVVTTEFIAEANNI